MDAGHGAMGTVSRVADGRRETRVWPLGVRHWGGSRLVAGLMSWCRASRGYVPAMKQNREGIKTENRM